MILTKLDTRYIIKSQEGNIKLEGQVRFDGGEMNVALEAFLPNDLSICNCSYKYRGLDNCTKIIADCDHQYISIIDQMLEDILTFLIEKFNLQ